MTLARAVQRASDLGLETENDEVLDVLDLPQLYTKPDTKTLLAILADLSSAPRSWDATPRSGTPRSANGASTPIKRKRKIKSEGVPHYLTKIISSPLTWIEDDGEKERIWEAASQRLSERSGRSAMGAISRTFTIPLASKPDSDTSTTAATSATSATSMGTMDTADDMAYECFQIILHEPALTADNLGLKTWASSYLLAKRLLNLRETLPPLDVGSQVLELGAGTGLVGIAAAVILQAHVYLTDLPEIVPNLERNIDANFAMLKGVEHGERGSNAEAAVLDWSDPASFAPRLGGAACPPRFFQLILAADPIYSTEHPRLLVNAIDCHLSRSNFARVVVEMPLRDAYASERDAFRDRMTGLGLIVVEEGEEVGYDDWSDGRDEEELAEVRCWWCVWGWR